MLYFCIRDLLVKQRSSVKKLFIITKVKRMKRESVLGWIILVVMLVAMAYGNSSMKQLEQSQKYGANACVNYNVLRIDVGAE